MDPALAKGSNGVFDLAADGKLLFSKHRDGRFPTPAEVLEKLKTLS